MDENALLGLGPQADAQAQQLALQYFEQLKAADQGWKLCANTLSSGAHLENDHVKFFCFQVIEHYLKSRYRQAGPEEHQAMKSFLMHWLQVQICEVKKERGFIKNKAAQIFSLALVNDYPHMWPQFFDDLLRFLQFGEAAVDMYLRVLQAIDSEVVDREIVHTQQETERNTMIKDTLRQQYVPQLVDSWYHILTTYDTTHSELTCQCLDVIGAYVSWIEITLIANDKFVAVLLRFMNQPLLRESTCDCIHEIISKGMDPVAKTKLIESFTSVLNSAGVLNVSEDEEGDYLAKLAKLVNGIGLQLIASWQKANKSKDVEAANMISDALENKIPLMFKFLSNEDDDVSGTVTQFAHDYITHLKLAPLREQQKQNIKEMLFVIMKKMKYDDSYSFETEGEEEAMFQEYRKELKIIFNNLGALEASLVLSTTHTAVDQILGQWQTAEFQDVEMAITMLYMLAEALPSTNGQHFTGDVNKVTHLQEMMRKLVTSRVSFYNHPAVALQFFETVLRYDKFFQAETQYIPDALMAFLDERGLRNPSAHVRSRSSYLFSRFVKTVNKAHLQQYLEEILQRIQELLVINSPDNGLKQYLSGDDQQFLYETAGFIIVQSQFPPEKKEAMMRQLLVPIVTKFDSWLEAMMAENDEMRQLAFAQCLNQAMGFASRTSKGFSNQQTMKLCGCVKVFTDTLQTFLHALDVPVHRSVLHQGVRQFLHRMVVCLETEILPFIPLAMENLLKNADARELHDFIPLINQVVMKFKKHIVPFLQEVFMPIVSTIFQVLASPVDERDQVAATEIRMLQRGYFTFIGTLVNNNVTEVLSQQESQNLYQVLLTVIQGAVELPDPQSQKTCFSILRKLAELWGGKTGFNGFDDFMYKNIVPACFHAPMKPTFDLSDAQTVLALNEAAACLKTVAEKKGNEFLVFLQTSYLPTLNLSPDLVQEFCEALKSEPKMFRNYFKAFFVKLKS